MYPGVGRRIERRTGRGGIPRRIGVLLPPSPSGARRSERCVRREYRGYTTKGTFMRQMVLLALFGICAACSGLVSVTRAQAASGQRSERLTATARRATSSPKVDGKLDEREWSVTNAVERDAIGRHNN